MTTINTKYGIIESKDIYMKISNGMVISLIYCLVFFLRIRQ